MVASMDFAGSGFRICRAVRAAGDVDARLVVRHSHPFGYAYDYCLEDGRQREEAAEFLGNADIIHFKGDEPPTNPV